jgi:glucose 1-dehydrogenase
MILMKSIAQELAPRGVRVNELALEATRTPINRAAWPTSAAYEALRRLVPSPKTWPPRPSGSRRTKATMSRSPAATVTVTLS